MSGYGALMSPAFEDTFSRIPKHVGGGQEALIFYSSDSTKNDDEY